jgi:hypothetical protein
MPINRTLANYIASNPSTASTSRASGVWTLDEQGSALAQNTWPVPPNIIQRSLRFNSADSTYLSRTPSSTGNQKTFTFSCWLKRSKINDATALFSTVSGSAFTYLSFGTGGGGDQLQFAYYNGSSDIFNVSITSAQFRDSSAWYHIVLAVDTTLSANRVRLYVNNIEPTLGGTQPTQNYDIPINSTIAHFIGGATGSYTAYHSDGYMTEINFVDGQQLTPSSFGETDTQTGIWIPKPYVGTYGTNGFRLNFSNNSSTTALGYDSSGSGNGNNWTANNFSVTPGTGNDSLVDVPSLYGVDTGVGGEVRGNYCTMNPLDNGSYVLSNGNLDLINTPQTHGRSRGTLAVSKGKWYWEFVLVAYANGGMYGIMDINSSLGSSSGDLGQGTSASTSWGMFTNSGTKQHNSSATAHGLSSTTGDLIMCALDMDSGKVWWGKNGTWFSGGNPTAGTDATFSNLSGYSITPAFGMGATSAQAWSCNFGQRPFAYTAPAGFKALCTTNLSAPAVGQTSDNQADNYFQVVTYSGSGSSQSIPNIGFQPDLIWIKNRTLGASNTSYSNTVYDTVRGINTGGSPALFTDQTVGESTASGFGVTAIGNNNFTVVGNGSLTNATGSNYVAWCWNAGGTTVTNNAGSISSQVRANQMAGFSIVSYAGAQASTFTVGHGLNSTPAMIITKSRNATGEWGVYYTNEGINTNWMVLNSTAAKGTNNGPLSGGAYVIIQPTNFQIAQTAFANSASEMIAYCWTAIPGYSSFGSYTANGITDGPFVYLGFRPKFIMIKKTSGTSNWILRDSVRGPTNVHESVLWSNLTLQEGGGFAGSNYSIDFLSNGFKILNVGDDSNVTAGQTYIYMAFAEHPTRLATAR